MITQILKPELYELVIATSSEEREKIYLSRLKNYQGDCDYLLNHGSGDHPGKDAFDDHSILFYISHGNEVAASCRCTGYRNNEWEISSSLRGDLPFHPDPATFVQFNRVLVDHRFRKKGLHELMFLWCSQWMMENTTFTSYFSVCKFILLRFYKAYGAELILADPVKLVGRGDSEYYFVKGNIDHTTRLLEENLRKKNIYQLLKIKQL